MNIVADGYLTKSAKQLAFELNCKPQKINDTWKRLQLKGKKRRQYTFDYSYFENINSQEKAYWLGFIYADGNVYKRGTNQGLLTISLNNQDTNLLEYFKKDIKSEHPLHYKKCQYKNKEGYSIMVTLSVISDKMYYDLSKWSCIPQKTFKIKQIPDIESKFIRHFVRGYFDGDGCVRHIKSDRNKKQFIWSIVGQKEFLEHIKIIMESNLKIQMNMYRDKRTENLYTLCVMSKKFFASIYKFLYEDSSRYLKRKKDVFEQYFQMIFDDYKLLEVFNIIPRINLLELPNMAEV